MGAKREKALTAKALASKLHQDLAEDREDWVQRVLGAAARWPVRPGESDSEADELRRCLFELRMADERLGDARQLAELVTA